MEPWLILVLMSNVLGSITTAIDKHVMNRGHSVMGSNILKMFFDGFFLLIIGLLFFSLNFNKTILLWSLLLGGIYAIAGSLWFKALKLGDSSVLVPFNQALLIILVFFSSIILFKDNVNFYNYIGLGLILIGIYAVMAERKLKLPKLNKAIVIVFIVTILVSIYSLLMKQLLFEIAPINLLVAMYFSTTLFLLPHALMTKKRKKSLNVSPKTILSAFIASIGMLLLFSAVAIGAASKVYSVQGTQSVFFFIIATTFLKEKFYLHRMIGVLIVFLGIFLISM